MRSLYIETSLIHGAWRYELSLEMMGGDDFDLVRSDLRSVAMSIKDRIELDNPQRVVYLATKMRAKWARRFTVTVESLNNPESRARVVYD